MKSYIKPSIFLMAMILTLLIPFQARASGNTNKKEAVKIVDIHSHNDNIQVDLQTDTTELNVNSYILDVTITRIFDQAPKSKTLYFRSHEENVPFKNGYSILIGKDAILETLKESGDYECVCTLYPLCNYDVDLAFIEPLTTSKTITKYISISKNGISVSDSDYKYPNKNSIKVTNVSTDGKTINVSTNLTYNLRPNKDYKLVVMVYPKGEHYPDGCGYRSRNSIESYSNKYEWKCNGTYLTRLKPHKYITSGYYKVQSFLYTPPEGIYAHDLGPVDFQISSPTVTKYIYRNDNGTVKIYNKKSEATNISSEEKSLKVGKKTTIRMDNCPVKIIKWKVSNKKLEIVNTGKKNVTIKGLKKGKAVLSTRVKGKTYKCKVTIK